MPRLSLLRWIGNAAAVFCGQHGDVTAAAEEAGCSRQSVYDHANKVQQALEEAQRPGPSREQLLAEVGVLRDENRQLWLWLEQALDLPADKQQQFTVTASAMGLSLSQILLLLAILLPAPQRPSRATLGRWVQQSARRASKILQVLDKACRPLILALCIDEIFFRRKPVLMAVEPASFTWVLAERAADRSGDTWAKALAVWPQLKEVAADGGTGIERGLELLRTQRQQAAAQPGAEPAKTLHVRLDLFHIRRDGARALRQEWAYAQQLWEKAEKVEAAKKRFDRTGVDARKFNQAKVDKAWAAAGAAFEAACAKERAWDRAVAALQLFRPDGQLNERGWAEGELRTAVAELTGSRWAKVGRQLADERTLTFLDRVQEELTAAEPEPERRAALVALWRWRRQQKRAEKTAESGVAKVLGEALAVVVQTGLGPGWQKSYRRISRALRGVLRASSAVECVNSVVRMHQARHRTLNQGLLDLKRLFWNSHGFLEGKRKGRCPYQLLGLLLPSYDPWTLLQMDPDQLEQILSSSKLTA
jgi:hypothetical protein